MKHASIIVTIIFGVLSMTFISATQSAEPLTDKERQARQIAARAKAWAFEADPSLPNVLVMGDSNTIGYVLKLRELLQGKANVYFPLKSDGTPDNCANSTYGLENIDRFVGTTKWAVIHFNWGLHDCVRTREEN